MYTCVYIIKLVMNFQIQKIYLRIDSFNTICRSWVAELRGVGIKLFSRVREACPSRVSARMENGQAPRQKTRRERGGDQDRRKMQEEDEERLAFRGVSGRKRAVEKEREEKKKDERKRKSRRVEATR